MQLVLVFNLPALHKMAASTIISCLEMVHRGICNFFSYSTVHVVEICGMGGCQCKTSIPPSASEHELKGSSSVSKCTIDFPFRRSRMAISPCLDFCIRKSSSFLCSQSRRYELLHSSLCSHLCSPPYLTMVPSRIAVLLAVALLFSASHALRFDLQSGNTKCIAEDIKSNSMTVGKYSIVNPNEDQPLPDSHKLIVRVTSAYGNSYHSAEKVESGQFAFTTAEAGDYTTCFSALDHKPETTLTVEFDWKTGVATKDWSNVAKKNQVEIMELELKRLQDTISSIHDEMFYLREREEEMQELNRATNSNMALLSFFSLVVCLSVAGLQLWHLKTFFEKKKLI